MAVKAFINNQDINNKPIINRANTNNVLSQPTKNLSKIKEQTAKMQKTFKNYPITQVSITTPPNTPSIKKQNKENQR